MNNLFVVLAVLMFACSVIAATPQQSLLNAATMTTTVFAEGQELAPGQSDPNHNPSLDAPLNWCKPGCQSGFLPPGQTAIGNPGQCQKSDGGDFCFEKDD